MYIEMSVIEMHEASHYHSVYQCWKSLSFQYSCMIMKSKFPLSHSLEITGVCQREQTSGIYQPYLRLIRKQLTPLILEVLNVVFLLVIDFLHVQLTDTDGSYTAATSSSVS